MGASVWMAPGMRIPVGLGMFRFKPLTMPHVCVLEKPEGLPIANTNWPIRRSADVPTLTGRKSSCGAAVVSTARSRDGSVPDMEASKLVEEPFSVKKVTRVLCKHHTSSIIHPERRRALKACLLQLCADIGNYLCSATRMHFAATLLDFLSMNPKPNCPCTPFD